MSSIGLALGIGSLDSNLALWVDSVMSILHWVWVLLDSSLGWTGLGWVDCSVGYLFVSVAVWLDIPSIIHTSSLWSLMKRTNPALSLSLFPFLSLFSVL